jgi:hypothetical protein
MSTIDSVVTEARALEAEFTAGNLSASEYKELLQDLQSTKVIEAAADDVALLSELNGLINGLIAVASAKTEDWMTSKWRPMMALTYMATIWFDFIVGPIIFNILQYYNPGQAVTSWTPLTLQGGGLYHLAMGGILGIAAYTRGKEKVAQIEAGESGK